MNGQLRTLLEEGLRASTQTKSSSCSCLASLFIHFKEDFLFDKCNIQISGAVNAREIILVPSSNMSLIPIFFKFFFITFTSSAIEDSEG